jgi:hypothetical protein
MKTANATPSPASVTRPPAFERTAPGAAPAVATVPPPLEVAVADDLPEALAVVLLALVADVFASVVVAAALPDLVDAVDSAALPEALPVASPPDALPVAWPPALPVAWPPAALPVALPPDALPEALTAFADAVADDFCDYEPVFERNRK